LGEIFKKTKKKPKILKINFVLSPMRAEEGPLCIAFVLGQFVTLIEYELRKQ
jgi:hypothetical protein